MCPISLNTFSSLWLIHKLFIHWFLFSIKCWTIWKDRINKIRLKIFNGISRISNWASFIGNSNISFRSRIRLCFISNTISITFILYLTFISSLYCFNNIRIHFYFFLLRRVNLRFFVDIKHILFISLCMYRFSWKLSNLETIIFLRVFGFVWAVTQRSCWIWDIRFFNFTVFSVFRFSKWINRFLIQLIVRILANRICTIFVFCINNSYTALFATFMILFHVIWCLRPKIFLELLLKLVYIRFVMLFGLFRYKWTFIRMCIIPSRLIFFSVINVSIWILLLHISSKYISPCWYHLSWSDNSFRSICSHLLNLLLLIFCLLLYSLDFIFNLLLFLQCFFMILFHFL